jgi:hypothetical protein
MYMHYIILNALQYYILNLLKPSDYVMHHQFNI